MKILVTVLFTVISVQALAQIKPSGKPPRTTNMETQHKASDAIKEDAAKKAALMNATLEAVYMSINQVDVYCRMTCEINAYFKEKKFALYAGSKGKIIDANSYTLSGNSYPQERYEFRTTKPILYKDLVNQNISYNIDLSQSYDKLHGYQSLTFTFRFSDGTVIYAQAPGSTAYKATPENKGEVHVSRYLLSDVFKDPAK